MLPNHSVITHMWCRWRINDFDAPTVSVNGVVFGQ